MKTATCFTRNESPQKTKLKSRWEKLGELKLANLVQHFWTSSVGELSWGKVEYLPSLPGRWYGRGPHVVSFRSFCIFLYQKKTLFPAVPFAENMSECCMRTWVLRFSAVSLLTRLQAIFASGNHLQLHLNTKAPPFRRGQESDSDIDIVFGTGELKGPLHIDTYRVGPMAVEKQPFAMIREMTGAEEVENVFKLQSYINFCGEE